MQISVRRILPSVCALSIFIATTGLAATAPAPLSEKELTSVSGGFFYNCYFLEGCKCAGYVNNLGCDGCILSPCYYCTGTNRSVYLCYLELFATCTPGMVSCGTLIDNGVCFQDPILGGRFCTPNAVPHVDPLDDCSGIPSCN